MKKNSVNLRSLLDKYQANCDRINAIADACEKEQRERTDVESNEYSALCRENQLIQMRMQAAANNYEGNAKGDAEKLIRENLTAGRQTQFTLVREDAPGTTLMMVSDAVSGGIIPVKVMDIVAPLAEELIYKQVGLPFNTGLAGDYIWPCYENVEASILGEGVALSDANIDLTKINPKPERIGVAIPVTREAINQSEGVLENIVRNVIPQAVGALINKILFSPVKVTGATSIVGPFVGKVSTATALGTTPTFKKLNAMKAALLAKGVKGDSLCWVMSKAMEATLEGEPISSTGIYKPIAENHMMCGLPIKTTQDIVNNNVEYIGLGDWRYQPAGLFGPLNFVVDPYSLSRKNCVDFVFNTDFATGTLTSDAFALGKATAS